ncbi:DNA-binding PucR family transcriptional regulator [Alkalihalobacillus xiaoxiensis]|uniref:DNA-binding PucR family transcriptional regulator n=1 Tax=Shouchella xiaoxiensis TaxID=766895 RepID=A0ABS2SR35_9BACI|nr:helix-turn-helix domain-containing protein [Shouchella xiaoxiensis]MBM7837951.1 DNA-binding PucR family transcriptional regulator [Shouchella xiaoxiensis]
MEELLRKSFEHALWVNGDSLEHRWVLQHNQSMLYLNRSKLTEREQLLLSLFLSESASVPPPQTLIEKQWHAFLYGEGTIPDEHTLFTAVHFHLEQSLDDVLSFREAVLASFPTQTTIIWKTPVNGMFLFKMEDEFLDLQAIVELIEADFYTGVQLFLGVPTKGLRLKEALTFEGELFLRRLNQRAGQTVFNASEAGLAELTAGIPIELFKKMQSHFFPNDILNDRELIKTIQVFLKNNMNMSQTAKELHLHRNSLQYRLDKFSTQTGIDVRVFYQSALTALLLAKK